MVRHFQRPWFFCHFQWAWFFSLADHPCDGCWLRVCEGKIQETRYEINAKTDSMEVTSDEVYETDAPAFINDSMGYHKVGNPSKTVPAVTLHLYCPPFDQCKIWLDQNRASRSSNACMCNYSEYGVKHTCEMFEVNMIWSPNDIWSPRMYQLAVWLDPRFWIEMSISWILYLSCIHPSASKCNPTRHPSVIQ